MSMSETDKYRHLTTPYLKGCGVDIGTGGYAPIVPHAISVELPPERFAWYTSNRKPEFPIHLDCGALDLPFKDGSLDFVYSSHLIEDFADWFPALREWTRIVKVGGRIVITFPDKKLWNEAIARGQPPNCEHRHESYVGEMSEHFRHFPNFEILADRLTALTPEDYSIMFVAQRTR